jgi:hypothetical protein
MAAALPLAIIARGDQAPTGAHSDNGLSVAPAHGWVLPLFTPEGYRSIILRGDQVTLRRDDRIDVEDIWITLFAGDAANHITTIIRSPEASYFPHANTASGPTLVQVLRTSDNSELSGSNWTYQFTHHGAGGREKLTIRHDARVVIQTQIHDFLQ